MHFCVHMRVPHRSLHPFSLLWIFYHTCAAWIRQAPWCMYVCMYVCALVYLCVYMCLCVYIYIYIYMHIYIYIYVYYVCVYVHTCKHQMNHLSYLCRINMASNPMCVCVCLSIYMCVCMYVYMYMRVCTPANIKWIIYHSCAARIWQAHWCVYVMCALVHVWNTHKHTQTHTHTKKQAQWHACLYSSCVCISTNIYFSSPHMASWHTYVCVYI